MFKYQEFIIEQQQDLILESLEEFPFILSDRLYDLLDSIYKSGKECSEIARLFTLLDSYNISKLTISFLDLTNDNKSISFFNPEKGWKMKKDNKWSVSDFFKNVKTNNTIGVGKLTRKVIELYNKKYKKDLKFSDKEIEDFVNTYKAYYDYETNKKESLKLISGDEIVSCYLESNYNNNSGTLGNSCMRYEDCVDFFDLYTNNKNVSLLILESPSGLVAARALIWTLKDGSKFMDRIYTNVTSDEKLFIKWAEENNCSYKYKQDSQTGPICVAKNDFNPSECKMEVQAFPTDFNNRDYHKFPFMDTFRYYYWQSGILSNYLKYDGAHFVELLSTDGWCNCDLCNTEGLIACEFCDGNVEIDCVDCKGFGKIDGKICDTCGGSGQVECDKCEQTGDMECTSCGGFTCLSLS